MHVAVVFNDDGVVLNIILIEDWMAGKLDSIIRGSFPFPISYHIEEVKKVYENHVTQYYLKGD